MQTWEPRRDDEEGRGDRRAGDGGFTLVELIIAILLISTAIAALLTAWRQNIQASVKHRDQSEVQTKVVSAANWIASNDLTFVPCNAETSPSTDIQTQYDSVLGGLAYGGAVEGVFWQPGSIVVGKPVEFWNPISESWVTAATINDCPSPDSPLQRVTVRVTHPSGSTSVEIEVVKSDVWST